MTPEIGCHLFLKQYSIKLYLKHTKLGAKRLALCVFYFCKLFDDFTNISKYDFDSRSLHLTFSKSNVWQGHFPKWVGGSPRQVGGCSPQALELLGSWRYQSTPMEFS